MRASRGNRLLSLIAEQFLESREPGDTVARMGGDEFVFLLRNIDEAGVAAKLTQIARCVTMASERAELGVPVSASLGAALYPADGVTAEELLALADRRMYLDKRADADVVAPTRTRSLDERGLEPLLAI